MSKILFNDWFVLELKQDRRKTTGLKEVKERLYPQSAEDGQLAENSVCIRGQDECVEVKENETKANKDKTGTDRAD